MNWPVLNNAQKKRQILEFLIIARAGPHSYRQLKLNVNGISSSSRSTVKLNSVGVDVGHKPLRPFVMAAQRRPKTFLPNFNFGWHFILAT